MLFSSVGKTSIRVSRVGFGTCQLRLVPEQQAIHTLRRGFQLGVNWVHAAPDYEGAEQLVSEAICSSGRKVMVFSQGSGPMPHFEFLFENTLSLFGRGRLEMFGIACIEDREYLEEPVWGQGGMIHFLQKKKQEGRLGGIFCSTHGSPPYVERLISSGHFDAVMIAYNPLDCHLLSHNVAPGRERENLAENRKRIFALAEQQGVGLFIMKPLAGGLLCRGKAFPPHRRFSQEKIELKAGEILRYILSHSGVTAVVPGTASVEEAEENALAAHQPMVHAPGYPVRLKEGIKQIRSSICTRCGRCEETCSESLPISWLFRDAYINNYPSETFETVEGQQYFLLHPSQVATCSLCKNRTCQCPHGIDIPLHLMTVHDQMLRLKDEGLLEPSPDSVGQGNENENFALRTVRRQIPRNLAKGQREIFRIWIQNQGQVIWKRPCQEDSKPGVVLCVVKGSEMIDRIPIRQDVRPGERVHFSFEIQAPETLGPFHVRFLLRQETMEYADPGGIEVFSGTLMVRGE